MNAINRSMTIGREVIFLVALNSSLTIENVYGIKWFEEDVLHALNSYMANKGTFVLNSPLLQRG